MHGNDGRRERAQRAEVKWNDLPISEFEGVLFAAQIADDLKHVAGSVTTSAAG
jgi:hypothetical protein